MIRALSLIFLLALPAQVSFALAPEISIRPSARPLASLPVQNVRIRVYFNPDFRPTARPAQRAAAIAKAARTREIFLVPVKYGNGGFQPARRPGLSYQVTTTAPVIRAAPVLRGPPVPRPVARPQNGSQPKPTRVAAVVTQPQTVRSGKVGRVCGRSSIQGENLSPISGRLNGCGIRKPVRVHSVSGVALSQPAIVDCDTAKTFDTWVSKQAKPTIGRLGGGLKRINVAAGYSCRTRNSQPGAELSEHGKGRAIDISGFTFANGKTVTVLDGWKNRGERRLLEKLHKSACGPFGTVLGPKSDRHHRDHFHFDIARHRGGAYCK